MASYTKEIGDIGASVIVSEFLKRGINVLLPYDDNSAYDVVIYIDNVFYKIQIKTTEQVIDNCMIFKTCKTDPYKKTNTLYTKNEVDFFAFYCVENDWVGFMSFEDYHGKETKIRLLPPKNNQANRSKMAENYAFHNQVLKFFNKDLLSNNIIHKEKPKYKKKYNSKLCPVCGITEIRTHVNMCRECYKQKTRENIPKKDELEQMIYEFSFVEIGKKYNVSDNTVRNWCMEYGLPHRRKDIQLIHAD